MHFEFLKSINDIGEHEWNALWLSNYPFTKHQFLRALENSGSTTAETGWTPQHMVVRQNGTLVFAMPLYLKTHSYGEYVFDWSWADAYARYGEEYYPKLINAIPFTPATGPRFAMAEGLANMLGTQEDNDSFCLWSNVVEALQAHCADINASGFHSLFPSANSHAPWQKSKLLQRKGCQFHWFNRNYADFDDFLGDFSSRKRKNIRKERLKCANIDICIQPANEVSEDDWAFFYQLYHATYIKRSGRPGYLRSEFFLELAQSMPEQLLLAQAKVGGKTVAGAIYFRDDECLYGRYWGSAIDIDGLHFETCYYRGIEYAIANGLKRFDPGAQGEHKIQRGFQPVQTTSFHWLAHPEFQHALEHFCNDEAKENTRYVEAARKLLPFREDVSYVADSVLLDSDVN